MMILAHHARHTYAEGSSGSDWLPGRIGSLERGLELGLER
jgi:hypothetical protein